MIENKNIPELRFPGFTGEWKEKKLGEVFEFRKGKGISKKDLSDKGMKCILYGQLYTIYNEVIDNVESNTEIDKEKLLLSKEGDILIPSSGETALDMSLSSALLLDGIALGGDINILRSKDNNIDSRFVSYQINSVRKLDLAKVAEGASVIHLYNSSLENIKATFPSFTEQEKIGSFFYTIDQKLDLQKKRIEELKTYKKGMMQRIFSQEIRFKDENGQDYPNWEEKKLGEVFEESTLKLKDIKERKRYAELLSVTLYEGIKKQTELGDSDTSSIDKSNYKIVNKNDIVYNSMRMWQGASGISHYDGIVSSAYVVLRPKKIIRSDFMARYFKDLKSIHKFYERSQGMTSDTLTLRYNLFKDILLTIPSLPEQEKIAYFLSALDRRIELEEERLEAYEEFKKGLMQRMFV